MLLELERKLQEQTKNRFVPSLKDLPKPESLKNCVKAAERIVYLLSQGKRMLIVGDYDADGIFATTILYSFLQEVGFSFLVDYIIPSRLKDGYGLSPNIINYALDNGFDFVVSVDNGVAAIEAIDLANKHNLEVIITDHHTAPKILPAVDIIVNPRVPGETFPYTHISGATVAWYLVAAIKNVVNSKIDIRKYLDYVAITIISDVMPLDNLNLALLKYGINEIKQRKRTFYKCVWNDWTAPTIDETAIAFALVPMINAIGRIDDANIGVEMFLSKDEKEIKDYYSIMKDINETRKELSRAFIKEAENVLISDIDISSNVIIIRNEDFHEGIVGIIAGKLAEKYKKPAYVLSYNHEKNIWKGSARSYANVHLYDLTNKATEYIAGFGGHKGAVGLAVKEDNWNNFVSTLREAANNIPTEDFIDNSLILLDSKINDFDLNLTNLLIKYGPYGHGNKKPSFKVRARIKVEKDLKNGLHYKCLLLNEEKDTAIVGLFFNVEDNYLEKVSSAEIFDLKVDPTLSYDLKNDSFKVELICQFM